MASKPSRQSQVPWTILFLLFIVLPLLVWIVAAKRTENRSQAGYKNKCWNTVVRKQNWLYWPTSCEGYTDPTPCTATMVKLTQTEFLQYNQWAKAGKPIMPGCNSTTPTSDLQECDAPNGKSCTYMDCPVCLPNQICSRRPCMEKLGTCKNNFCYPNPTPTPTPQGNCTGNGVCYMTVCPTPICNGNVCYQSSCMAVSAVCINGRCVNTHQ